MKNIERENWDKIFTKEIPFDPDAGKLSNIYDIPCKTDVSENDKFERLKTIKSPESMKIVVGLGNIIPLWKKNVTLRWRFDKESLRRVFRNPAAEEIAIRDKFQTALSMWGDAKPIDFIEDDNNPDFEILMSRGSGLSKAFFPNATGDRKLKLFPRWRFQDEKEQVDTFIHELGHIFGLRHFKARTHEPHRPAQAFGKQDSWTIMNLSEKFELTPLDRSDLKKLYDEVWNRGRGDINGVPIVRFPE